MSSLRTEENPGLETLLRESTTLPLMAAIPDDFLAGAGVQGNVRDGDCQ